MIPRFDKIWSLTRFTASDGINIGEHLLGLIGVHFFEFILEMNNLVINMLLQLGGISITLG